MKYSLLILPFLLFACAHSADKKACRDTDYYQIGLEDGQTGKTRDRLAQAHERCDKLDVPVADAQYQEGYRTGVSEFCTPERAQTDAIALQPSSVCRNEHVTAYTDTYNHQLEEVRAQREHEIGKVQDQAKSLEKRKAKLQGDLKQIDKQKAAEE